MFVCRLDRPWLGTPFLMQGFLIQTQDELLTLQQLCDQVYIDTEKSLVLDEPRNKAQNRFKRTQTGQTFNFTPKVDRQLAKAGLSSTLPVYTDTLKTVKTCFKDYQETLSVSPPVLEEKVENCLAAVMTHTTAMSWLTRVKSHDKSTSEHAMHVSLLAMVFAVHCGWSREEAKTAGLAGLLFDLGKVRIPRQILAKPGALSESEWQMMHDHPKWGRYYLEKSGFDKKIIDAAYFHHERPDGKGYPTGRPASQTPILARLIHILDAYDSMISYRPYGQERTVFDATKLLYRGRGTEFDTELVNQFIEMNGVFPIGTLVELNTGEVGVIIGQNHNARLLPKLSIVRDSNKNPVAENLVNLKDYARDDGRPQIFIKTMLTDGSYGVFMKDYTRSLVLS